MAKKILLADDSVTIQKVVELTFMDEDYEVAAVSNGDEALAQLDELAPDLVIADVHMPGADGYQVCREVKQKRPGLPVLLLVGTFEPFQEEDVEAAGADGFLKKPFDSQELLRRVEELLAAAPVEEGGEIELAETEPIGVDEGAEAGEMEEEPEISAAAADEMEPWGPVSEELPDDVASPEEIWQGEPLEGEEVTPELPPSPVVGDADELELEPSPWTEAENAAGAELPGMSDEGEAYTGDEGQTGTLSAAPQAEETPDRPEPVPALEPPPELPGTEPGPAPMLTPEGGRLSDEDVDRIARRVVEILGQGVLQEVAWEVVPDLAELVIKDRVRELERQLE
jgi:CheY-like chemotaxis protein